MKLYKLTNGLGEYYVIAEHPTEAEEKLINLLDKADYGPFTDRAPREFMLLAESADDIKFITGKRLVL